MNANFSNFADVEIPESEINGSGGATAPRLWLPLRLNAYSGNLKSGEAMEICSLDGEIAINHVPMLTSEQDYIGFILPHGNDSFRNQHRTLIFSLDAVRLAALERIRTGNSLKFQLKLRLIVRKLHALNPTPPNKVMVPIWGYGFSNPIYLQTEVTIPRDIWISRVLENTGYGKIHIIEMPVVPLEACVTLEHAYKALQLAQDDHKIGRYDDAVGKCRIALDKFFKPQDKTGDDGITRRVPVLAEVWLEKLGQSTYDWLNSCLSALKEVSNKPHHSPNIHFDQFTSQMIIAITTAIIAYAARTPTEPVTG